MADPKPLIVVAGDVAIDWISVRIPGVERRDAAVVRRRRGSCGAAPHCSGTQTSSVRLQKAARTYVLLPTKFSVQ
jgi:hypothetical protein